MINESNILNDLKQYHIIDQNAEPEAPSPVDYERYSADHFNQA